MAYPITILTLFPEMFPGTLGHSIMQRAKEKGLWDLKTINIRDFATDNHKTVDDTPYGGGAGMVMKADIVAEAIREAKKNQPNAPVIFMTPSGTPFSQKQAVAFSQNKNGIILLCGHYEGIDQRVLDAEVDMEISIGDYVLSGGEIAAQVVVDAVVRNIPEVLGNHDTLSEESFDEDENGQALLEYPHYTRPESWEGTEVPEVLRSGNHQKIKEWRREKALAKTKKVRPDML
jgi:tRNA (guanine37-N1)-methyltransferase